MDKLTLEHLAPYLAFDLKVNFYCKLGNYISTGVVNPAYAVQNTNQIKPILRPVSDMTSEHIISMFKMAYRSVFVTEFDQQYDGNYHMHGWDQDEFGLVVRDEMFIYGFSVHLDGEQDIKFSSRYIGDDSANKQLRINKLDLFKELYKYHFDIHGLIPKGLAVDINTIDL